MFLIRFVFKVDENPLWSIPPLPIKTHLLRFQCMFLIRFLFKTDGNHTWSIPPLPMHVSDSILILNWWSPLSEASLLYQCVFLMQFSLKIDEKPLWSIPPLPMHVSYSILIQNWWNHLWSIPPLPIETPLWSIPPLPMHVSYSIIIQNWWKSSLKHPSSSNACFLLNSYWNLMKHLSEASFLYQCKFLIQILFKTDINPLCSLPLNPLYVSCLILNQNLRKSSSKHPSYSNACFLFNSHSQLMNSPLKHSSSPNACFC